jgi:hypothetical protein
MPRSQISFGNVSCSREIAFRADPIWCYGTEIGNEIASAIAFPSETWERGMPKISDEGASGTLGLRRDGNGCRVNFGKPEIHRGGLQIAGRLHRKFDQVRFRGTVPQIDPQDRIEILEFPIEGLDVSHERNPGQGGVVRGHGLLKDLSRILGLALSGLGREDGQPQGVIAIGLRLGVDGRGKIGGAENNAVLRQSLAVAALIGTERACDRHLAQLFFQESIQRRNLVAAILIVLQRRRALKNPRHDPENGGGEQDENRQRDHHLQEGEAAGLGSRRPPGDSSKDPRSEIAGYHPIVPLCSFVAKFPPKSRIHGW